MILEGLAMFGRKIKVARVYFAVGIIITLVSFVFYSSTQYEIHQYQSNTIQNMYTHLFLGGCAGFILWGLKILG